MPSKPPTTEYSFTFETLRGRSLDLGELERELGNVENGPSTDLGSADLDGDRKIAGPAESRALFQILDEAIDDNGFASTLDPNKPVVGSVLKVIAGLAKPDPKGSKTRTPRPNTPEYRLGMDGMSGVVDASNDFREAVFTRGVGTHWGDVSPFGRMSTPAKRRWIARRLQRVAGMSRRKATEEARTVLDGMKRSSCIEWGLEHLEHAYYAAGRGEAWDRIRREVFRLGAEIDPNTGKKVGIKGTELARLLQEDGWTAVAFFPDPLNPKDNKEWQSRHHKAAYRRVRKAKPGDIHPVTGKPAKYGDYWGTRVDEIISYYRPTDPQRNPKDMSGIEKLAKVPFWYGVARAGSHIFVGHGRWVSEFKRGSSRPDRRPRNPNDITNVMEHDMAKFEWNSGIIMVPPGWWPADADAP